MRTSSLSTLFAANRTDDLAGYHLALATCMRALPHIDDDYHYRLAAPPAVVVEELLAATPVHLAIIDAIVSSHGSSGARAPRPLETECVIASPDIVLADCAAAIKMGLDPGISPLMGDHGSITLDLRNQLLRADLGVVVAHLDTVSGQAGIGPVDGRVFEQGRFDSTDTTRTGHAVNGKPDHLSVRSAGK